MSFHARRQAQHPQQLRQVRQRHHQTGLNLFIRNFIELHHETDFISTILSVYHLPKHIVAQPFN